MVTDSSLLASDYELIQLEDIKQLLFSADFKTHIVFTCLPFANNKAHVFVQVCCVRNNFKVWYLVCEAQFFFLTIYIYAFSRRFI